MVARQWIFFLLLFLGCSRAPLVAQMTPPVARSADLPAPLSSASWHRQVADHQGVLTNNPCRVALIGDSLTEFWCHTGVAAWSADFAPLKCANLGIAGDRTEHILWRIENLDFRRANPRVFVLLMGTNNLGMVPPDPPEAVVRAMVRAVGGLTKRFPASHTLVLEIPPNGFEPRSPLRQHILETNALLAQTSWPAQAKLIPLYSTFVDEKDRWKPGLTLDGTHFSAEGYRVFAGVLLGPLNEALGASSR
jgi:lysophospholipase L1-like esterase